MDPTSILMTDCIWQLDASLLLPLTLQDMEIRATHSSGTDLHNDIERRGDLRLWGFVELQVLVISNHLYNLHGGFDLVESLLGSRERWTKGREV